MIINDFYENWSISNEIKIQIIDHYHQLDYIKDFRAFNNIYKDIITLSLNQIGKIIYFIQKINGIYLPIKMHLSQNQVNLIYTDMATKSVQHRNSI